MVSRPVARDDRPVGQPDNRRRGRRVRRWVIVLVVLALVLVGADFGAAAYAEHTISQKAREQLGNLSQDPSVTVHGFPFLTQALSGDYSHISVYAAGVPVQDKLRDVELSAELENVTAPLSDLLAGNTKTIKIGSLKGQVTVKASDFARFSPLDKVQQLKIEPVTEDYVKSGDSGQAESTPTPTVTPTDADGQPIDSSTAGIRISGYVQVAGQKVEIFCFALISVKDKKIEISPNRLQFGNDKETTVVPPAVQKALLPNFRATINAGDLPFSVTPTAVRVNSGSVTIKGEAKNVTFTGQPAKG
ncbi:LmeA family phospholipid-binding protein [Amycolatopsis sp. H20-H5]|uniref:LmeA family phospholipid-binding protein n=1 Tax=Amycolatopsis sp. H20-H5 TaxID=3046309 RepID=UPI002DB5B899|nr:DUF2993 domain-containing protein [Amycolatopsis sp. H20-H5]MEC3977012.1 DUF2993 domain-containing protein [Amycolatopsis sp. H20-H5]